MQCITDFVRRLLRRGERGAGTVEYALVVAAMIAGSTSTFDLMDDRIEEHYVVTATDIGQHDIDVFNVTTTTTTTSTVPVTTTTTVAPTTTTAAPDEQGDVGFRDRTSNTRSGWKAKVRVRVKDDGGNDLTQAAVSVTFTLADGTTANSTGQTNDSGRVTFQWPGLDAADFPVTVHIDSIEDDQGTTYGPDENDFVLNT